jgi:hypothetical protein
LFLHIDVVLVTGDVLAAGRGNRDPAALRVQASSFIISERHVSFDIVFTLLGSYYLLLFSFTDLRTKELPKGLSMKGFQIKVFSILFSQFEEVMYLDLDNIPIVDPAFAFDLKLYKKNGLRPVFSSTFKSLIPKALCSGLIARARILVAENPGPCLIFPCRKTILSLPAISPSRKASPIQSIPLKYRPENC